LQLLTHRGDLALFGDELAVGLGTPLAELAHGHVRFGMRAHDKSAPYDWVRFQWMADFVRTQPGPTVFLGVFRGGYAADHSDYVMQTIETIASTNGSTVAWLGPPGQSVLTYGGKLGPHQLFAADDLDIQLGPDESHPTAVGYAGWAGAIWAWLT
jgi:hypothetical protein